MQRFLESEVIVTDKGRIYHLDLEPHEIANIVLLVGDPDRVPKVSRYFEKVEHTRQHREFVTHTGQLGNVRISCVSTGIGTDNVDIVMNEVDMLKNYDLQERVTKETFTPLTFIRLGTSGSIQEDIDVDDIVFSHAAIGLDGLLNFYQFEPNTFESTLLADFCRDMPQIAQVCRPYCAQSHDAIRTHVAPGFKSGITITSPSFYAAQGRRLRIPSTLGHFPDLLPPLRPAGLPITNFEMETSGIYGLARLMGHRAGSFNVILANRPKGTFSKDPQKTVDKLLATVLERLRHLDQ
ncbi:MAG: nucleoside phosphorylase [Acidobacteria bacterium]|nr:nucleoside phosphorylase [Acidobacteriota bacterium]